MALTSGVGGYGMRRVSFIRVERRRERVRLIAVGVGHRLPTEREVPASAAAALVAAGVPVVTERVPTRS